MIRSLLFSTVAALSLAAGADINALGSTLLAVFFVTASGLAVTLCASVMGRA